MKEKSPVKIDLESVIKSKTDKKIPRFLIRGLEKLIHQDEFNRFFANNVGVEGIDFVDAALKYLDVKINIYGEENIPSEGKFIFASNHPLGGLDGLALSSIVGKKFGGEVCFLVNSFLMNLQPLAGLFIPINVGGKRQERDLNEKIEHVFETNKQLLIFPAGVCSRKINGKIQDLKWKKTFIKKAIEHQRTIIPVYFEARNSNFFYNLARLRNFLKIKLNIEMAFLPHEMFKQKGNSFSVTFGKPIPAETFNSSKRPEE
ncbi:MAG: 1-acyl-sn-glycerol-3-phosphate acyltransferase, partial [Paludibacteraceae bacterium]|nr:1-acyl-sn-glycerol-3-phosphate acyltransferase [Paludibacteraceae bacterium]